MPQLTANDSFTIDNAYWLRRELFAKMLDRGNRDIDDACGYHTIGELSRDVYRQMYDREGIGTRITNIYPDESWSVDPEVYETEDQAEDSKTPFEEAWAALEARMNIWHYLHRVDRLSGIGHFGLLLIGLDDGKPLMEPIDGFPPDNTPSSPEDIDRLTGVLDAVTAPVRRVTYLRVFDESLAYVSRYETNMQNIRYGQPIFYNVTFADLRTTGPTGVGPNLTQQMIHWSRVVHIADNRMSSEVFGVPRMQDVWNYLLNVRKILGGSGEMFWKGGFPGYSFELNPDVADLGIEFDPAKMKAQMEGYFDGMQRYLALIGVSAKSLAPQVSDPTAHLMVQLQAVAIAKGVPLRILLGTEEGKLAGGQDDDAFDGRITQRQRRYLTPMLIRLVIDRLIMLGCLPAPKKYFVDWPDMSTPSDTDKATVALQRTQALSAYVSGGCNTVIGPEHFLTLVLDFTSEEVEAIAQEVDDFEEFLNPPEDPVPQMVGVDGKPVPGTQVPNIPPHVLAVTHPQPMPPKNGKPAPAAKTPVKKK